MSEGVESSLWGGCSCCGAAVPGGINTPISLPGGFSESNTGGAAALLLDLPPTSAEIGSFLEKSNH